MHTLSRHISRLLVLLACSALIGWAAWHLSAPAPSAAQAQEATKAALQAARARLDQALADKKEHRTPEAAEAVEEALAAYNAAVEVRGARLQQRIRELESLLETAYAAKGSAEAQSRPEP